MPRLHVMLNELSSYCQLELLSWVDEVSFWLKASAEVKARIRLEKLQRLTRTPLLSLVRAFHVSILQAMLCVSGSSLCCVP